MSTESDAQELAAFGQAVRELREQRGMSVDDLSSASQLPRERKMSSRRVSRIEAGEVDPTTTR
jgi:transcriptional regulator with XRE-family HTH domain